jgi:STE24 endopeptidase
VLGLLLGAPLLFCVLWLMEKMGESWWLYAWFAWIAFNLFVLAIFPTWIAPLFNKFTPLEDADAENAHRAIDEQMRISKPAACSSWMVRAAAITATRISQGFGKTKRIVFFDTLLARLNPSEIEAVLAHELGHFKHHVT